MKFWIDKDSSIYLFQLLKAAGILDDYEDIRHTINKGLVSVNEENVFNQRYILKGGDVVRFKQSHVKILERDIEGKTFEEKMLSSEPEGNIKHGNVKSWKTKPLKPEINLNKELENISRKLHDKLLDQSYTISCAESCTGGLIQEILTSHSGSSGYFVGGIVSYADKAKTDVLKVRKKTITEFGAVSRETAIEMAKGIQKIFGTDIACAVTGIAGPEGGTQEKPVGTVHAAYYYNEKITHNEFHFSGNRETIRKKAALTILKTLFETI
ncbi:MAG: CinA family protein [Candidatus Cloacimonetes bacterium]|nr:CinA family protein [Candidatus Cloacimonadota bacterium]